jgi:hypothetical protein
VYGFYDNAVYENLTGYDDHGSCQLFGRNGTKSAPNVDFGRSWR